jgi:hypothetical protein
MLPEIASLDERMAQGGDWMQWREEIANLHQRATTQEEYVTLLRAHSILGHLIDEVYDEQTAEKIRPVHSGEYKLFLNKEAMGNGERINPAILDMITAREVEAGRMDPNDDFRQLAAAGGQVLGDSSYLDAKPARRGNWVALAFAVLAIVLWALSVQPLGFSALWLIAVGFVVGTLMNNREITQIKHRAEVERARRGY